MDSFTHIVLGAATGGAVLGKKAGNKALFWGALAGSIPDFDVAITPLVEPSKSLFIHRGFTHSILFALLLAPLLGRLMAKIHRDVSPRQWALLALCAMLVHSLIDCLNTYGTALLEPFSGARLAFDSIGIIDFTLLLPLLILMAIAVFSPRSPNRQKIISWVAMGYTLLFVSFTVVNKTWVERTVRKELSMQGIDYLRLKTAPLPLTNFLWMVLAEDSTGYHIGYLSNFDRDSIKFSYVERNSHLLGNRSANPKIENLIRFSEGYYALNRKPDGSLWMYDLRFSGMAFDSKDNWYVFSFRLTETGENDIEVSRSHPDRQIGISTLAPYWKRTFYPQSLKH